MKRFFTSDHHFNHKSILSLSNRPFSTPEEMYDEMIVRWNKLIKPKDEVFHLGDFCFSNKIEDASKYLSYLNGKIFIIKGNHDNWIKSGVSEINLKNKKAFIIESQKEIRINGVITVLSHYPMRTWNKSHYGSYHLYGHEHGNIPSYGFSMDVGVDTNNFYPYSEEEIIEIISKIKHDDYKIFTRKT